jgi:hypothetical protein
MRSEEEIKAEITRLSEELKKTPKTLFGSVLEKPSIEAKIKALQWTLAPEQPTWQIKVECSANTPKKYLDTINSVIEAINKHHEKNL